MKTTKLISLYRIVIFWAIGLSSAQAQFSKVEYEIGKIGMDQVGEVLKKVNSEGNYLHAANAFNQLKTKINVECPIESIKTSAKTITGPELYRKTKASTIVLVSSNIRASGYVIDKSGICVTNYHVMKMFADTTKSKDQVLLAMLPDGKFYPVTAILAASAVNDIAVIKVDTKGRELVPLSIGVTAEEGSDIFVMGHPSHMLYYFSKGIVAKNFIRESSNLGDQEDFRMAVTADYSLGESGGPIVNDRGDLVGMVSSAIAMFGDQQRTNPQMVVKSAIPVIALKKLLKR